MVVRWKYCLSMGSMKPMAIVYAPSQMRRIAIDNICRYWAFPIPMWFERSFYKLGLKFVSTGALSYVYVFYSIFYQNLISLIHNYYSFQSSSEVFQYKEFKFDFCLFKFSEKIFKKSFSWILMKFCSTIIHKVETKRF